MKLIFIVSLFPSEEAFILKSPSYRKCYLDLVNFIL